MDPQTSPMFSSIASSRKHHAKYYFEDGNAIILIENTLYNLHRYLLKQADHFKGMFTLPPGEGNVVDGLSDDAPIRLGVIDPPLTSAEFDCFVHALYTPIWREESFTYTKVQRMHILRVADYLGFDGIRTYAVQQLERLSGASALTTVERLELGGRYDVPSLLPRAYVDLCCELAPLDGPVFDVMLSYLGKQSLLDIQGAREAVWRHLLRVMGDPKLDTRPVPFAFAPCKGNTSGCHTTDKLRLSLERVMKMTPNGQSTSIVRAMVDDIRRTWGLANECSACSFSPELRISSYVDMEGIEKIVCTAMGVPKPVKSGGLFWVPPPTGPPSV